MHAMIPLVLLRTDGEAVDNTALVVSLVATAGLQNGYKRLILLFFLSSGG